MSSVYALRRYDSRSDINWRCDKCKFKFGEIPDSNGIVTCRCGNTNSIYSQFEILSKRGHIKFDMSHKYPQRIVTGIRPNRKLHLGNYFGSINQFIKLQRNKNNECFVFVADLHALTSDEVTNIDQCSIDLVRTLLSCGIDKDISLIYRQSDIPEISYLATLLGMITPEGLLKRGTTYKDKSAKSESVSLGLLSYPVLMAADILIFNTDTIPVGEDQLQHLEIVREIANRFNNKFGKLFKLVNAYKLSPVRVPSLDGSGKMGLTEKGSIYLTETPESIRKKISAAKTDIGPTKGKQMPISIKNLYYLLKLCSSSATYKMYKEMYDRGEQKFYGELKKQLANDIIELTEPFREKYFSSKYSENMIRQLLTENCERVRPIARRVLRDVEIKLGFNMHAMNLP